MHPVQGAWPHPPPQLQKWVSAVAATSAAHRNPGGHCPAAFTDPPNWPRLARRHLAGPGSCSPGSGPKQPAWRTRLGISEAHLVAGTWQLFDLWSGAKLACVLFGCCLRLLMSVPLCLQGLAAVRLGQGPSLACLLCSVSECHFPLLHFGCRAWQPFDWVRGQPSLYVVGLPLL